MSAAAPSPLIVVKPPATATAAKTTGEFFLSLITNPWLWTGIITSSFFITFGMVFVTSGVDLNSLDPSSLKVWWVGTILSSALFLLLFYVVFAASEYFNKSLIFLLLMTFVLLHVSLLLTQINFSVK